MYAIAATVVCDNGMRQVPTFYLDESVQGIVSDEHACEIAMGIINPMDDPCVTVHVTAYRI